MEVRAKEEETMDGGSGARVKEEPHHEQHRRGWFDIVMGGSNEAESESEDESQKKRKYR